MTLDELLQYKLIDMGDYYINVMSILVVIFIIIGTRLILALIKKAITAGKVFRSLDSGQSLAYYQIIKYVIIVMAIAVALESFGVKITFLLAGSAALLVGVGLGLQQLFNDLMSGFIILTEHSIKVNDIIEIGTDVVEVKQIGLRTSKVETRNRITVIVPNSKIVNENVTNWSHNHRVTRFSLNVGVAYGSDVNLVSTLLIEAAKENEFVDTSEDTTARFTDFGDSALIFELLFWSEHRFRIEDVKSKMRFAINKKFKDNHIQIPFPQRDLHVKTLVSPITEM